MIQLTALLGQDAVSLQSAAKTGTVKGIGVTGNQIVTVELSDAAIAAGAVRSFEGDVLTYDEGVSASEAPTVRPTDPRGLPVLDANGDTLGRISDLTITAEGIIDTIELSDGQTLVGTRLRAIGSYAAIVTNELPAPSGQPLS